MIMARNEDGTYSQVGFVKDNAGIDTEYIYDKDGDIVFEKGFTRETSGTVPLTINGIGKDLKAWSITGNTVQNGTPTPDNPVEVQAVGDRTGNLFDYSTIRTGYRIAWATGVDYADNTAMMSDYIKVKNTTYSCSNTAMIICYDGNKKYLGALNKSMVVEKEVGIFCDMFTINDNECKFIKLLAYQGVVIGNKTMLNEGSTPLPYEPYGYKIPVVTRGKNLFNYNLMFQNSVVYNDYFNVYNLILKPYTEYEISTNGEEKHFNNPALQSKETQFIVCNTSEVLSTVNGGVSYKKKLFKTTGADGVLVVGYRTKYSVEGANIVNKADMDAGILWLNIIQTPITTPIYLPTPLYSGEVMRSDGTITRSDGTTETFTAPQIPTLNGTTVIDVDTAVKPTEMYTKYKSSK